MHVKLGRAPESFCPWWYVTDKCDYYTVSILEAFLVVFRVRICHRFVLPAIFVATGFTLRCGINKYGHFFQLWLIDCAIQTP
jgi:hypothetical protein